MTQPIPDTGLQLQSLVKEDGILEIFLKSVPVTPPKDHEVVVKILATPINPSDLGLLVGGGDISQATTSMRDALPLVSAPISPPAMRAMAGRMGEAMPVGNEGCGVVIAAGASDAAQALMGKTVAVLGGAIYGQYRTLPTMMCMALPDGTDPKDGASCFVNPLTSLAFTKIMKRDGYQGIVHTAAASNLGQMLVKICKADGIPLVNIVRSQAHADLLKSIGAEIVLDSSADNFLEELTDAITKTGAFLGFDAIGGGKLSGQILGCMESAAVRRMTEYSRYGSDQMKQVYIYGALDLGPTILGRNFGLTWGLGGFLLTPFLQNAGVETQMQMRGRIVSELTTTFASHYSHEISLEQALDLDILNAYNAKRTGEKYLIRPNS